MVQFKRSVVPQIIPLNAEKAHGSSVCLFGAFLLKVPLQQALQSLAVAGYTLSIINSTEPSSRELYSSR